MCGLHRYFVFKQKTAYEMRISDWSSDVCSSDLRWLAFVGDAAYAMLMRVNVVVNAARRRMGLPYWSLSKMAKHKVKNAVEFISRFEEVVAHEAGADRTRVV